MFLYILLYLIKLREIIEHKRIRIDSSFQAANRQADAFDKKLIGIERSTIYF